MLRNSGQNNVEVSNYKYKFRKIQHLVEEYDTFLLFVLHHVSAQQHRHRQVVTQNIYSEFHTYYIVTLCHNTIRKHWWWSVRKDRHTRLVYIHTFCSKSDHVKTNISNSWHEFISSACNADIHPNFLLFFTFMWPCIVTNFFIIKPTRCTNFTNLFWHETLHVSGSSSVHHQEFIHCTLSNGICHTSL